MRLKIFLRSCFALAGLLVAFSTCAQAIDNCKPKDVDICILARTISDELSGDLPMQLNSNLSLQTSAATGRTISIMALLSYTREFLDQNLVASGVSNDEMVQTLRDLASGGFCETSSQSKYFLDQGGNIAILYRFIDGSTYTNVQVTSGQCSSALDSSQTRGSRSAAPTVPRASITPDEAWRTSAHDIRMRGYATINQPQKRETEKARHEHPRAPSAAQDAGIPNNVDAQNMAQSTAGAHNNAVRDDPSEVRLNYLDHMHEWEAGRTLKEIERLRDIGAGPFTKEMIERELRRQDQEREKAKVLRGMGPVQMIFILLFVAIADPIRWLISILCAWFVPNHAGAVATSIIAITALMLAISSNQSPQSLLIGAIASAAITSIFFLLRRKLRNKKLRREVNG